MEGFARKKATDYLVPAHDYCSVRLAQTRYFPVILLTPLNNIPQLLQM